MSGITVRGTNRDLLHAGTHNSGAHEAGFGHRIHQRTGGHVELHDDWGKSYHYLTDATGNVRGLVDDGGKPTHTYAYGATGLRHHASLGTRKSSLVTFSLALLLDLAEALWDPDGQPWLILRITVSVLFTVALLTAPKKPRSRRKRQAGAQRLAVVPSAPREKLTLWAIWEAWSFLYSAVFCSSLPSPQRRSYVHGDAATGAESARTCGGAE